MSTKIIFNGKEYKSIDEMPSDVRHAYEKIMTVFADKNQNGVPDIMEGIIKTKINISGGITTETRTGSMETITTKIVVNGQEYDSVEQMPLEVRRIYEKTIGKFSNNDQQVTLDASLQFGSDDAKKDKPLRRSKSNPIITMSTNPIEETGSFSSNKIVIGVIVFLGLLVLVGLWLMKQ